MVNYNHLIDPVDAIKFENIVVVAGSRGFNDVERFEDGLYEAFKRLDIEAALMQGDVVFVSGMAKSGADKLIIDYCEENGHPWTGMPAQWDDIDVEGALPAKNRFGELYNKRAGMMRNAEMARLAAKAKKMGALIAFYDGQSPGTKNMLQEAKQHKLHSIVLIVKPNGKAHGQEPQSRRDLAPGTP